MLIPALVARMRSSVTSLTGAIVLGRTRRETSLRANEGRGLFADRNCRPHRVGHHPVGKDRGVRDAERLAPTDAETGIDDGHIIGSDPRRPALVPERRYRGPHVRGGVGIAGARSSLM